MVARLANLVQETVPAPGTGTVQLAGVVTSGFVPFTSQFLNGDIVFYCLSDGLKTEIGEGTYSNSAGVATLVRTTVLWSSLGGTAKINFTASCRCWSAIPAERAAYLDDTLKLPFSTMPRPLQDRQTLNLQAALSSANPAIVPWDTIALNQNGFGGTLGKFTVATTGWYSLQMSLRFQTTTNAGSTNPISLQRLPLGVGPAVILCSTSAGVAVPNTTCQPFLQWEGLINATDVIQGAYAGGTVAGTTIGGDSSSHMAITRISN
jgi:hypothetical protein